MKNHGFTLLELMMAVAILTIVMGTLFSISLAFANSAEVQEIKITTTDEARRAYLRIAPILRQAVRNTVNWGDLPGDSLSFQTIGDTSGTGWPVDTSGEAEVGGTVTIQRDVNDANGDGITMSQLVLIRADGVDVLANGLEEGVPGADVAIGADIPDGVGFWVAPRGAGLDVTIRTVGRTRRGHVFTTTITEYVLPRN